MEMFFHHETALDWQKQALELLELPQTFSLLT